MMHLVVAALALLSPQKGRWTEIGTTGSGNPVFVDSRTVRKAADGIITATVRVVYGKPVKVGDVQLTSSRAVAMFNCTTSRFAVRENTLFIDEKSNKVYQKKVNKIPGYGPTLEGNFADVAMKHFCAKR
jgi:hypothetical protein